MAGQLDRSLFLDVIQLFLTHQSIGFDAKLRKLEQEVHSLMATVSDLNAALAAATKDAADAIARVAEDVKKLKDDIANGGTVKESELDSIKTGLEAISASLKAVDPLPEFPAPPPPVV